MIPMQVRRIALATALIVSAFLIVRSYLVPSSFGKFGHYRADSVTEIAALPVQYGGDEACTRCHAGIDEIRATSPHRSVRCESCHGPSNQHALDPVTHPELPIADSTKLCLGCHESNPSKPADFPQVSSKEHRPGIQCVACHNPHAADFGPTDSGPVGKTQTEKAEK